jgi:hypothetical protein
MLEEATEAALISKMAGTFDPPLDMVQTLTDLQVGWWFRAGPSSQSVSVTDRSRLDCY